MQASIPPPHPEWRTSHMPKLSYRSAGPINPSQAARGDIPSDVRNLPSTSTSDRSNTTVSTDTGRRSSAQGRGLTVTTSLNSSHSRDTQPAKKKNNSIFAAFFVKEQTNVALEQVAAQLIAQHGELTPRAVPGVSSAKMPDYVPKVNSKWDGVPEVIKQRERQERERNRASNRYSAVSIDRSTSATGSRGRRDRGSTEVSHSRTRRSSNSTLSSFDSRGGNIGQSSNHLTDRSTTNLPRTNHAGVSGELPRFASRPVSLRSESLRSPSGSSLPEITAYFPDDIPAPLGIPAGCRQTAIPETSDPPSNSCTHPDNKKAVLALEIHAPSLDAVPGNASSPTTMPHETFSVTPSPNALNQQASTAQPLLKTASKEEVVLVSAGPDVLSPPVSAKKKGMLDSTAFLAGEARPLELPEEHQGIDPSHNKSSNPVFSAVPRVQQNLEKRPDSSRARLGLRASMIVRAEHTPWDWQDGAPAEAPGTRDSKLSLPVGQKNLLSRFGK